MNFETAISRQGMPVYVFPMPHAASIALGILVFAGTRDEKWPEEAGLAHAFEHMLFQGNSRMRNSKEISGEIDSVGGSLNAFTSKEMTFYHRVVPCAAFDIGVKSLVGQVKSSLFRENIRLAEKHWGWQSR